MTGDGSSSWNSPSLLYTPTAPDKAYDDHIRDTVISCTNLGYSHRVHVTAVIPQVRGLLPYYRSRGLESYRPSLQGFHMTIPASQFSQVDTYRCNKAAFSKRDKCSMGSVVPSYSTMAGVRQFIGSSSAITVSMKGMPCRSSSGTPSIRYFTSCKPL
ncbi:UNVERIFIED_CONTAM: hypothetical protein Slati_3463100 [Sesamum latifolium]|uniref:Uncharacterized protein n=1 Tax=Sesamum latifolium TaxID=2727402 RepID=A0AAW2UIZ8_9LAMI